MKSHIYALAFAKHIIMRHLQELRDLKSVACTCKALSSNIQLAKSDFESNLRMEAKSFNNREENSLALQTAAMDQMDTPPLEQPAMNDPPQGNLNSSHKEVVNTDESSKATPAEAKVEEDNNSSTLTSSAEVTIRINTESSKSPQRVKRSNSSSNSPRPAIPGERVSKRVRSQMLSSEKETERQAKRSSIEYCFLSGVFSCTSQDPNYVKLLKSNLDWEKLPIFKSSVDRQSDNEASAKDIPQNKSVDATPFEMSSLGIFLETTRVNNSGPKHLLDKFLVYAAMHPDSVFSDRKNDPSSCILDGEYVSLHSQWHFSLYY